MPANQKRSDSQPKISGTRETNAFPVGFHQRFGEAGRGVAQAEPSGTDAFRACFCRKINEPERGVSEGPKTKKPRDRGDKGPIDRLGVTSFFARVDGE